MIPRRSISVVPPNAGQRLHARAARRTPTRPRAAPAEFAID
jgi:hypothetical protein